MAPQAHELGRPKSPWRMPALERMALDHSAPQSCRQAIERARGMPASAEALVTFDAVLAMAPDDALALVERALVKVALGDRRGAPDDLDEGFERARTIEVLVELWRVRALFEERGGNEVTARDDIERAAELSEAARSSDASKVSCTLKVIRPKDEPDVYPDAAAWERASTARFDLAPLSAEADLAQAPEDRQWWIEAWSVKEQADLAQAPADGARVILREPTGDPRGVNVFLLGWRADGRIAARALGSGHAGRCGPNGVIAAEFSARGAPHVVSHDFLSVVSMMCSGNTGFELWECDHRRGERFSATGCIRPTTVTDDTVFFDPASYRAVLELRHRHDGVLWIGGGCRGGARFAG